VILRRLPPLSHQRNVALNGTAKNVPKRRYGDVTPAPFNLLHGGERAVTDENSKTELVRMAISKPSDSTGYKQWAKTIPS
jgi:hypothetical protein